MLLQSLNENLVADSFPITKGTVVKTMMICAMKEKFEQVYILIEVYIRELLSMLGKYIRSQLSLIYMYDKLECHLRFLDVFGVTIGKCAAILCP